MIYEIVKEYDVVPNIRRAGIEGARGLGDPRARRARGVSATRAIEYLEGLGCTVNRMEGDVLEGDVRARSSTGATPRRAALAMLREIGDAIVAGCRARGARRGWCGRSTRILDAWGRLDRAAARARRAAARRGRARRGRAGRRPSSRRCSRTDPAEQRATPLEIVRDRVPGADRDRAAAAGVPEVVRDPFDERAWPDDRYGLVPRTLGDLGDPARPAAPGVGDGQGEGAAQSVDRCGAVHRAETNGPRTRNTPPTGSRKMN